MSGKYTFVKSLREVRFLFCQQSEGSNAVRYNAKSWMRSFLYTEAHADED